MEGPFTAHIGAPVYAPGKNDIWAYWTETRNFESRYFKFLTRSQLLEGDDFRRTEVTFNGSLWVAGPSCRQQDFAESPFFYMNPLQGPQARLAALRTLLADPSFSAYFQDADRFKAYERHLAQEAQENLPW